MAGILVISGYQAFAEDNASKKIQWKANLYGLSADDSYSSSKVVGAKALLKIHHEFSDSFAAKFRGGVQLETGSSSALFTDEFAPASKLLLEQASFDWKIFNPFKIEAGAVDQSHHKSILLVNGGTFPAALGNLDFKFSEFKFYLDGQGAIPTGKNLNSKSSGKEATPLLLTQKAVLSWERNENNFSLRATHFSYENLNRQIAQDSRFYGNSVSGISSASSFIYKYSGFEVGPDYQIKWGKNLFWNGGFSYLYNQKAPKSQNAGLYAYTSIRWENEDISLSPKAEYYRNEADSAPAYYSSAEFGHNNRVGHGAVLNLSLLKTKLDFEFKYRNSELIDRNAFQKNKFEFFQLTIGIPYESI